eukprot:1030217-Pyramimonas_sp.AAC.1
MRVIPASFHNGWPHVGSQRKSETSCCSHTVLWVRRVILVSCHAAWSHAGSQERSEPSSFSHTVFGVTRVTIVNVPSHTVPLHVGSQTT